MSENLQAVLEEVKKLPLEERRELATRILDEIDETWSEAEKIQANLAIVEELHGSLKGLDRETVKWLAEDEELCGY